MTTQGASHPPTRTGWVGWVYFSGIVLLGLGVIHFVNGLVALFLPSATVVTETGLTAQIGFTAIGLTLLIGGVLLAAVGGGVLSGQAWARGVAVALAVLSIVANAIMFAAFPVWSVLVIILDVVVIYALLMHGRETEQPI